MRQAAILFACLVQFLCLSTIGSTFTFSLPSPGPTDSFLALHDTNDRTPPDPQGAVGPNHVMTALNTSVRFQTREGALIRTVALSAFWASAGNPDPFDPRCAYDPFHDRWILVACANRHSANSALLIGVSHNGDPTGQWHLRRIDNVGGGTNWIDYPSLGFNKNWIVVQALMKTVADDRFSESQIYVFNKADAYAGLNTDYTLFRRSDIGPTQSVAVTHDPSLADLYLVSSPVDGPTNRRLQIFAIQGTVGSESLALIQTFESPEPWATKAPGDENLAPQLNSSHGIHLQDSSMQNVVYRNGSIWCVHHIFLPPEAPARSAIQWWQLSTNAVIQRGRIEDPQFSFGYPSIAVNRNNDVLIGYSRFSTNQFASANYSFRGASDPSGHMRADTVLKAGEGPYFKTRGTKKNRWGDFSSTVVDPLDDLTFWTVQPYAAEPVGDPDEDGSGRWGTWWGKIAPPSLSDSDTDSDGIPDGWELAHRFDPNDPSDAHQDSDNDGHTNRDEFLAGTDPRDSTEVLQFLNVTLENPSIRLSFQTAQDRIYTVERRSTFSPGRTGSWIPLTQITGTGSIEHVDDTSAITNASAFYRLRVEPR